LLIADEVGLGKTIEAGLIMIEMQARQDLRRILIVCPSNLKYKWQLEMHRRFGEDFKILMASHFHEFLDDFQKYSDQTTLHGIISIETIRQNSILERLDV